MYVRVTIMIYDDEETAKDGVELIKKTNDNEFKSKIENNEFCWVSDDVKTEEWLAGTGATSHITTCDDVGMTNIETVNTRVIVGNREEILCTKRGDILLVGENILGKKIPV